MTTKGTIPERIRAFNAGRRPELLERKYKAIRADAFTFLRGTCHLFYEDWPASSPLNAAPPAWISGDLHLENFGSYKGDNRLVYFDINDFDEAALAPSTWEITRLVTSVFVGARKLKLNEPEALALGSSYLEAYRGALDDGHARVLDRGEATGMVKELLRSLKKRARARFLDGRTVVKKGRRRFKIDGDHCRKITDEERARVERCIAVWAAPRPDATFFKVLDVARRIAGTGSLGVERYAILVQGRGSPDQNFILDLKSTGPSALEPFVPCRQPTWANHAARAVTVQRAMQGTPPALLKAVVMDGSPYVLKELQPTQDRVALEGWDGRLRRLEAVLATMGRVTAWDQLRSSGRRGSAIADDLIAFAARPGWKDEVLAHARGYAAQVQKDFEEFRAAGPGLSGGSTMP